MPRGLFSAPNSMRVAKAVRSCFLVGSISLFPVLEAQPQSNAKADDPRVMQLYSEAKSDEQSGDIAGSISKYQSILAIAPRLGPAYNNLGALYLRQHQYTKAIAILKQGLEVDRSMYSATILLGVAYYEEGDYKDARQPLETAVRANSKDNNAELYLAKDLIKLEDFGPAATHLQELTKREPNNQEIWYMLGNVYIQLSEAALAKVDAIDPNSVLSHEIRGDVMASMKNFDGALVEYKKAVEIGPQQTGTHYKLGNAYWQLDAWADATEQFQAELANDPGNCNARWKLGDILLEQHVRPEEALDDINQALQTCPISDGGLAGPGHRTYSTESVRSCSAGFENGNQRQPEPAATPLHAGASLPQSGKNSGCQRGNGHFWKAGTECARGRSKTRRRGDEGKIKNTRYAATVTATSTPLR